MSLAFALGGEDHVLKAMEYWVIDRPYFGDPLVQWIPIGAEGILTTQQYKRLVIATALPVYWRENGWPEFCRPMGDYDFECGVFE